MAETLKRNIAYKIRIGDINNGETIIVEDRLKHVELGNKKIIRVNIVANVVDKFFSESEKQYATFTLDDASGQIRLKMFGDDVQKFKEVNPGDSVMVIGLLRYFNGEVYISPEIIFIKDPKYLLLRKLELELETPAAEKQDKNKIMAVKDQIIDMMKEADSDGGIDTDNLILNIKASPDLINQEIKKMLEDGLAYEPRPGKIRYLG